MTNDKQPTLSPKNQDRYSIAIAKGLEALAAGGSKADAARTIYEIIEDEERDVIVQAFIDGANVTMKGAPTYFYNVRRQIERKRRDDEKKTPVKSKKKSAEPVT
jgi:hypothetical protein